MLQTMGKCAALEHDINRRDEGFKVGPAIFRYPSSKCSIKEVI